MTKLEKEELYKKLRNSVFDSLVDFRIICFNKAKDNQVVTMGDYEYIYGRIKMAFTIFEDFKPNTSLTSSSSDLLEACRLAHECIVTRAGVRNNASEKDKLQDRTIIDKTIKKLEQVIAKAERK